ncbi:unnamed protein product [Bursaphelenchus okinawaensis]|uniref:Uncharacterized protein n=1 Tax=Bursaphelenchus okinawaensis TaxID=465554 RepID=A0A811KDD1_9BILA|nr:unnamed protein product [Bursaphelenchus okinawaensis]CAG9100986.1 unnamed protein product [Bursaphelenchus okinawaensis]
MEKKHDGEEARELVEKKGELVDQKRENWCGGTIRAEYLKEKRPKVQTLARLLKSLSAGSGWCVFQKPIVSLVCLYLQNPCLDLGKGVLGAAFRKQLNTPSVPDV